MSVLGGLEHRTVEDAEEGGGESCRGHDKAAKETRRDAATRGRSRAPLFLRTPTRSKPSACPGPAPRRGDHASIRTLGWLVHTHLFITSSNSVDHLFLYILHLRLFKSYLVPDLSYLGPGSKVI